MKIRGVDFDLDEVLNIDKQRRALLAETEALKNRRNVVSEEIGAMKKAGKDVEALRADMRALGDQISSMDQKQREIESKLHEKLLYIPNIPHASVPEGKDASGNQEVRRVGEPRSFEFKPKPHWEIGEKLGLFDFTRATKMTGAGFPLYTGLGARLERALIQFMLDLHTTEHGYKEISTPFMCNRASMTGTGQLPRLEGDMYHVTEDDLWLIPTAEVPITNFYREEIINGPLPIYLTAYSPCFRREASAAGKVTRGLIRIHQFDKVEMVKFVEPETSYAELESLCRNAETVLQRLGLVYRVMLLCTGDMSMAAAKCYDLELWAPGHNAWLEVSSCSNFEDYQARRAQIRYRNQDGKVAYVHTLNGSGVALPRLVVAILENYQEVDGTISLPEALWPYMGGIKRLE